MVKGQLKKLTMCSSAILACAITLCAQTRAAPVADKPLFMGAMVKPNLMLAIDDSGSMDFEILLSTNDGGLWWERDINSFVNDDGSLVFKGDTKYAYLFPNGYSVTYNGSRMRDNSRPAVPPIKAYAFIRSADYNRAYYDPGTQYIPWPTYGGFSFNNVDPAAAPWDPVFSPDTFHVDLTRNLNSSLPYWQFFIGDADMVCDDHGTRGLGGCSLLDSPYNYYPATYYVKDTTSTYLYNKPAPNGYELNPTQNTIIETESVSVSNPMTVFSATDYSDRASGNAYIGSDDSVNNFYAPPNTPEATYRFNQSGTVNIWIRRIMKSDDSNSIWMSLKNGNSSNIMLNDFNVYIDWHTSGTDEWHRWWLGHDTPPNRFDESWQWELWGRTTLTGSDQELKLAVAEGGVLIDQILVTNDLGLVPTGKVELDSGVTVQNRSCGTDRKSQYYHDFVDHPDQFTGVDAIAPDGSCLKKYEIKPATSSYPSGRSYSDEMQNFANWFTYYRRRHHAMRGGMAHALDGIKGINTGMFYINESIDVNMEDFDVSQNNFLTKNYMGVQRGDTPLRSALDHAGNQFMRTDPGAPITASCQKNYTLLFTDGYNTDLRYSSVANADQSDPVPFRDNYASTLADVARHFYKQNLRPDLPAGEVPVHDSCGGSPSLRTDCNANLHMNTFTVGLGTDGRIFGVTHFDVQDAFDNPPVWPNVNVSKDPSQVDDLYHAAINGHGEVFSARNTSELKDVLTRAVQTIIEENGSGSSVAVNSSTLDANSLSFSASFKSDNWSGEFVASTLDPVNAQITSEVWNAATMLENQVERTIITYHSGDGVPFSWSSLNRAQQDDLNTAPNGGSDTNGQARLDFIRGDSRNEGLIFRNRVSPLGDITHSSPVYIGAPEQSWPDKAPFGDSTKTYSAFKKAKQSRKPVVYIGANDGMLHGFNATASSDGGQELLAYIPSGVYSTDARAGLHYLADPAYDHKTYVDLPPAAADVFISTRTGGIKNWHTVLVGGLRGGGKGIFALDVTDPSDFSESNAADIALWEFTANDDPDLGYIIHKPAVAMMANNKWAVILGNGYNSGGDGNGHLFILFIEEGLDGTWESADYVKIPTGVAAGLSAPAIVDLDGDQIADRIYAGDLAGNMWAFDVEGSNTKKWEVAYRQGRNAAPLFNAEVGGSPQPITAPPLVVRNTEIVTDNSIAPNVLVLFGTGKYFSLGDPSSSATQSFYGVWDAGYKNLDRNDLEPRTIVESGSSRTITGAAIDWSSKTKKGYRIDLTSTGERVITTALVRRSVVFFNTMMPNQSACETGGAGWLMSLDAMSGKLPDEPAFDVNNDNVIDSNDTVDAGQLVDAGMPSGSTFIGDSQIISISDGSLLSRRILEQDGSREGRLGWVEKVKR